MSPNLTFRYTDKAEAALQSFSDDIEASSQDQAVHDLLCDIGHICDRHDMDYCTIAARALSHWQAERNNPNNTERAVYRTLINVRAYVERVSVTTLHASTGDYADFELIERLDDAIKALPCTVAVYIRGKGVSS